MLFKECTPETITVCAEKTPKNLKTLKNFVLLIALAISIASCQDKTKKDAASENPIPANSETQGKAAIDFESDPVANEYRTVISEKYNELEVNFASYYIITTWGCGSGCVSGAMVDTRDGRVYPMPEDQEWGGNGTYIDSNKESAMLLTVLAVQSPTGEIEETRKYWEWDEGLKQFEFAKVETVVLESNE